MSKQNKSIYSYWLAVPCLILYGLFFIIPAVMGLGLSFLNIRSFDFSQATFAGLRNYINVLSDSGMNIAIKNSFIFAAVTTVLKVILGMVLAVFLNNKMRTTNFLRTVFFFASCAQQCSGVPYLYCNDASDSRHYQYRSACGRLGCNGTKLADRSAFGDIFCRVHRGVEVDRLYDGDSFGRAAVYPEELL